MASGQERKASLQKSISFYIRRLDNLVRHRMDQSQAKASMDNITGLHGFLVGYLYHHQDKPVYQRDLERDLKMCRSTITAVLQLMEKNGLIVRTGVPDDARKKQIHLTDRARTLAADFQREIHETERLMEEGIREDDLRVFQTVIHQMIENLEKQEPQGSGNEETHVQKTAAKCEGV